MLWKSVLKAVKTELLSEQLGEFGVRCKNRRHLLPK